MNWATEAKCSISMYCARVSWSRLESWGWRGLRWVGVAAVSIEPEQQTDADSGQFPLKLQVFLDSHVWELSHLILAADEKDPISLGLLCCCTRVQSVLRHKSTLTSCTYEHWDVVQSDQYRLRPVLNKQLQYETIVKTDWLHCEFYFIVMSRTNLFIQCQLQQNVIPRHLTRENPAEKVWAGTMRTVERKTQKSLQSQTQGEWPSVRWTEETTAEGASFLLWCSSLNCYNPGSSSSWLYFHFFFELWLAQNPPSCHIPPVLSLVMFHFCTIWSSFMFEVIYLSLFFFFRFTSDPFVFVSLMLSPL